jgi:multiple sugar transport system permease protein
LDAKRILAAVSPSAAPFRSVLRRLRRVPDGPHWAYLFILPSLILVAVVVAYPMVTGLLLSLQRFKLNEVARQGEFVGLQNYARALADPVVLQAATTTFFFVSSVVIGSLVVGLSVALVLYSLTRGAAISRLILLVPLFLPSVVASYTWAVLLDGRAGMVNDVLTRLGAIHGPISWFADPKLAFIAVVVIEIWHRFPLFAIFLLAAMYTIPHELAEAAAVDGAGAWARFRRIKLPLLRPIMVISSILVTISVAQSPDVVAILTGGGPARATTTLSLYSFQTGYLAFDLGYAAAIACILFAALAVFVVAYVPVSGILKRG